MASVIICPSCAHEFDAGDSFKKEVQEELRAQMEDWKKRKEKEFSEKETSYQQQLLKREKELNKKFFDEKQQLQKELQESVRKTVAADYENQLKLLQQGAADSEEKLKEARKKELEFLQREKGLKDRESEMELNLQRQLLTEREKIKGQLQKEEQEKMSLKEQEYQLRMREMEKQLEDQKKLVDEMKRKAEQGSMQLQGEVQELLLEEILHQTFPFDNIKPVGKGVRGADCIQYICNPLGQECGKIIYESKRTNNFSMDWIDKLKSDMRSQGADIAVIVTQAFPKDMERFGEKDGVYICSFTEVRSLASVLRTSILKVFALTKSQSNRGDKMHMLYDYLTGNEFSEQWKAIREGFMSMKLSIQRERDSMEKLWKAREKQLEKVLLNAAHIRGSIEGIAGADAVNLNLVDDETNLLE
ncbi:DUF2130 domain-containing protein [soil metagenome]